VKQLDHLMSASEQLRISKGKNARHQQRYGHKVLGRDDFYFFE
jgi:hypothetical protein